MEYAHLEQGSPEWFEARSNFLTCSNYGAACGLNPFKSRGRLWAELTGMQEESQYEPAACTYGKDYEAFAIGQYELETGMRVTRTGLWLHPLLPFLAGSPDGIIHVENDPGAPIKRIIEVKCPYSQQVYAQVPAYYMPQVQGLLDITGAEICDFICWTPTEIKVFEIRKNETYCTLMNAVLQTFWTHVIHNSPPAPYRDTLRPDCLSPEQREIRAFKEYARTVA